MVPEFVCVCVIYISSFTLLAVKQTHTICCSQSNNDKNYLSVTCLNNFNCAGLLASESKI